MNTSVIIIVIILVFVLFSVYFQVRDYFSQNDHVIQRIKGKLRQIHPAADKVKIYKSSDSSYTINKKHIYLCLKDENNNYYNDHVLLYVSTHEMAHCFCESIGHTEEFDQIFKKFLDKAVKLGLYDPDTKIPENYCNFK